jgi:thymidylate synthase
MMRTYQSFTRCYQDLLASETDEPEHESAPRGQSVRESLGVAFRLADPRDRLAFLPGAAPGYAVAETLWYLSGSDSTEWIAYYAPFWRDISDDGKTANSAYGARIFRRWHPRVHGDDEWVAQEGGKDYTQSQWEYVKEELRRDPDSRRAVIQIRSAADSWLASRDVPCTLALQFFLRGGALHMVANMRSSDLVLGIPHDVFAFTCLQELMALELGVGLGRYTHVANSLHVYDRDRARVDAVLGAPKVSDDFSHPMPAMTSLPPTVALWSLESKIRGATDGSCIAQALQDAVQALDPAHSYWLDWIRVLAAHRAARLKLPTVQRALLASASWDGWAVR